MIDDPECGSAGDLARLIVWHKQEDVARAVGFKTPVHVLEAAEI